MLKQTLKKQHLDFSVEIVNPSERFPSSWFNIINWFNQMMFLYNFSNVWSIKNSNLLFLYNNAWKSIRQVLKPFGFFTEWLDKLFQ